MPGPATGGGAGVLLDGGSGKSHRKAKAGRKADKRKTAEQKKKGTLDQAKAARQNPRAFAFQSAGKAKRNQSRSSEKDQRRMHAPMMERAVDEPPPLMVLVHGPPGVGKTTLIQCLVKHFTKLNLNEVKGPITAVAGKKRRITFVECPPDLNGMLDAAKYADLVLLMIDGSFGFEMETFEFLNLLQVHGFPKVMGVLTHLDGFTDVTKLKKTKKKLKARFWTEIYDGAKLFYLSGCQHGKYLKREVLNLARFISIMKMRPLTWRLSHPYVLADRFEDITPREIVRATPKCDREIVLYGYLRGTNMKDGARVHLAGVGDYTIQELDALPDPCPLPDSVRKRGLSQKEKVLYAPMADVGGLLYDKDAVYIDIPDWKVQFSNRQGAETTGCVITEEEDAGQSMVRSLQGVEETVDEKLEKSKIQLFGRSKMITGSAAGGDSDDDEDSDMDEDEDGDEDEEGSDDEEEESGSEWSDDEDAGAEEGDAGEEGDQDRKKRALPKGMPTGAVADGSGGRVRRRAVFGADDVAVVDGAGEQRAEGEEESSESEDESDDEDEDDEGLGAAAKWKSGMLGRASALFSTRGQDLTSFVYGRTAVVPAGKAGLRQLGDDDGGADDGGNSSDSDGDFFKLKNSRVKEIAKAAGIEAVDGMDSSRIQISAARLSTWDDDDSVEQLRNRFVTGDWAEGQKRSEARPSGDGSGDEDADGGEEEEEIFGDFKDMETGEKFQAGEGADPVTAAAQKAIEEAASLELREKRIAKKAAFDNKYDGKGAEEEEDENDGKIKTVKQKIAAEKEEESYYDCIKRGLSERQAKTKNMLDGLDPHSRVTMEGHRPGTYVRMRFTGVPFELVQYMNPCSPLLVGGLGQNEEKLGVMKMRFKRHRWSPKILKNRDPLVFSVGWRRFQSIPIYAIEDHNRRLRMLKYTPEHQHCVTSVYGPLAPPNSGVVAIQNLSDTISNWRISGTGVVLELDAEFRVVKKLKLVGNPYKIARNTAFIGGMFNSQLEASKFEGASVKTVSNIRGTIKKAVRPGGEFGGKDGSYRATFEDKILMSDIVFLRAWVQVDIPRFYNPVTNLLASQTMPSTRPPKYQPWKREALPAPEAKPVEVVAPVPLVASTSPADSDFDASSSFSGARSGFVFKLGPSGLGYYTDLGPMAVKSTAQQLAEAKTAASAAPATVPTPAEPGWVGMRTVAQMRRDKGIAAPRNQDSLYRDIERAPRRFNPLKIPKALQAALPFKSKPKVQVARKSGSKTLDQKRAVVLEPQERKAVTLLQQLNAIRNERAGKRREQQGRKREERAKKTAKEDAWKSQLSKEERKKRYRNEGQAEKRKEMGGKFNKKKKSRDD